MKHIGIGVATAKCVIKMHCYNFTCIAVALLFYTACCRFEPLRSWYYTYWGMPADDSLHPLALKHSQHRRHRCKM